MPLMLYVLIKNVINAKDGLIMDGANKKYINLVVRNLDHFGKMLGLMSLD